MTSHHDVAVVVASEEALTDFIYEIHNYADAKEKAALLFAHLEAERQNQAKALSEAEAERDAANKELADFLDPRMQSMRLEDGRFDVAICGKIVERVATAITGWFRESGAKNYVEMTLNARDEPFEKYTFTVQKRGDGARSTHELRLAAETRLAELDDYIKGWTSPSTMRQRAGEMTAQEVRTVQAVLSAILDKARAFTNAAKEKT